METARKEQCSSMEEPLQTMFPWKQRRTIRVANEPDWSTSDLGGELDRTGGRICIVGDVGDSDEILKV